MASIEDSAKASEPSYAKAAKPRNDYLWYVSNIDKHLIPQAREFFEKYCHIPTDQQSKHVHEIRDQAFDIRTYPCIGIGAFLVPYISFSPAYKTIVARLQAGDLLLDVGCCLGGDLRRLAFDGAPTENMYAVDIVDFWTLGWEMYRDQDRFHANFILGDILDANDQLASLKGRIDVISLSAVMHQWDWDTQVKAGKRLVAFSKPGSILVGHQIGNTEGKEVSIPGSNSLRFLHNVSTFKQLWKQIGDETDTVWEPQAWIREPEDLGWDLSDQKWMSSTDKPIDFVVTRNK